MLIKTLFCVFLCHAMRVSILFPQIEESSFYGRGCNVHLSVPGPGPPTLNTFILLYPPGMNCTQVPTYAMLFLAPVALLLSFFRAETLSRISALAQLLLIP